MSKKHRCMKFIAYVTKGLEQILAEEIKHIISNAALLDIKPKRVIFEFEGDVNILTKLRTVDDIGMLLGSIEASSLNEIISFTKKDVDFMNTQKAISNLRAFDRNQFSITTTLTGVKNFTSQKLINKLEKTVKEKYGWQFTEFDHSNFDIRVFIDRKEVYISVRLTKDSLHHRKYKTAFKEGSLKPTIAAAMVQLTTGWKTNLKVVDNFCGSGTILCEALIMGNEVYGGDIDPESVDNTAQNLSNLGYESQDRIKVLNGAKTNWQDDYFDCAISNLPWGKQVEIESITQLYLGSIKENRRILKLKGNLCLIISKPELLIKYAKEFFPEAKISTFKVGYLGQNPTIILIKQN